MTEKRAKERAGMHAKFLRKVGQPSDYCPSDRAEVVRIRSIVPRRAIAERYRLAEQPAPLLNDFAMAIRGAAVLLIALALPAQAARVEPTLESILSAEYGAGNYSPTSDDWFPGCPESHRVLASHTAAQASWGCFAGMPFNAATNHPLVGTVWSFPLLNADLRDHMLTFVIVGRPSIRVFAFEDIVIEGRSDWDYQDLVVEATYHVVETPEPSTVALLGACLMALPWVARRRRR